MGPCPVRMLALLVLFTGTLAAIPVRADDLADAAADFRLFCAPCHGKDARGHGPAAVTLKAPPADLTQIKKRNGGVFPEASVFDTIVGIDRPLAHGTQQMPVWGNIFIDESVGGSLDIEDAKRAAGEVGRRITDLVNYLKSIQVAE